MVALLQCPMVLSPPVQEQKLELTLDLLLVQAEHSPSRHRHIFASLDMPKILSDQELLHFLQTVLGFPLKPILYFHLGNCYRAHHGIANIYPGRRHNTRPWPPMWMLYLTAYHLLRNL